MMQIEIRETIDYNPTIEELANEIWELNAGQQCKLINALGGIDEKTKILAQLGCMYNAKTITDKGKFFCRALAEYLGD